MFFARCVVYLGGLLPKKSKFSAQLRLLFDYYYCTGKVVAWHKAELERLDAGFRIEQAGIRLVAARGKAIAEGIGPLDPSYPDFDDFLRHEGWEGDVRFSNPFAGEIAEFAQIEQGLASSADDGFDPKAVMETFRATSDQRMQRLDEAVRAYPQERVDAVTKACVDALKKKGSSGSGTAIP